MTQKMLNLLGYASGLGAANPGCAAGPLLLQNSPYLNALTQEGLELTWQLMTQPPAKSSQSKLIQVHAQCEQLALAVRELAQQKRAFTVLGGDHTCAIGTWSGVASANKTLGPIGLIWIDAHMDSHTTNTSQTGNLHGMPLACLLGYGEKSLVNLLDLAPKIQPTQLCLIGIRSYEEGEEKLLNDLNVRIFYIEEVKKRGLKAVFAEALQIVTTGTIGYGITLDLDSIDPTEAPGTGVREPNGLATAELQQILTSVAKDPRLLGTEIVEFDPHFDENQITEKLIPKLIKAMILGK